MQFQLTELSTDTSSSYKIALVTPPTYPIDISRLRIHFCFDNSQGGSGLHPTVVGLAPNDILNKLVRSRGCYLEATELKDLTSTSFGYIIAFLLPGLACLYGVGLWYNQVPALLQPASNSESTLGPSLVFLLASTAAGLLVSAVRWLLYEKLLCKSKRFASDHFKKLQTPEKLSSFKAVVDEHYRYHQFFGGMSIGLLPLFVAWIRLHRTSNLWLTAILLVAIALEALLIVTGIDTYCKYVDRGNHIVGS